MKNRYGFTLETTDALNMKILDCGLEINLGILLAYNLSSNPKIKRSKKEKYQSKRPC